MWRKPKPLNPNGIRSTWSFRLIGDAPAPSSSLRSLDVACLAALNDPFHGTTGARHPVLLDPFFHPSIYTLTATYISTIQNQFGKINNRMYMCDPLTTMSFNSSCTRLLTTMPSTTSSESPSARPRRTLRTSQYRKPVLAHQLHNVKALFGPTFASKYLKLLSHTLNINIYTRIVEKNTELYVHRDGRETMPSTTCAKSPSARPRRTPRTSQYRTPRPRAPAPQSRARTLPPQNSRSWPR